MSQQPRRRAVFLDRDGTLIQDTGFLADSGLVQLLPGAIAALREFAQRGFALVIVSNQSGVGRRIISPEDAESVHERVVAALAAGGVRLSGAFYCFHAPSEQCVCRKPSPGLLFNAARDLNLDLEASYMIGDRASDIEAGRRAGCKTVLLNSSREETVAPPEFLYADRVVGDWLGLQRFILENLGHD